MQSKANILPYTCVLQHTINYTEKSCEHRSQVQDCNYGGANITAFQGKWSTDIISYYSFCQCTISFCWNSLINLCLWLRHSILSNQLFHNIYTWQRTTWCMEDPNQHARLKRVCVDIIDHWAILWRYQIHKWLVHNIAWQTAIHLKCFGMTNFQN